MTGYIGHDTVRAALERELPPVTLLIGPTSVGKWTLANHLATHHRVAPVDRAMHPDGISVETVRAVIGFVGTAAHGTFKLVLARLDNSSDTALAALLKTIEEPPGGARFLFTAAGPVPPTIASRASIYRLGLLNPDELSAVLRAQGMNPEAATRAAAQGRGQVRAAQCGAGSETARATVLTIARALATSDRELYDRAFRTADDDTRDMLHTWLREAITGRWLTFTPADTFGLHTNPTRLRAMLTAVCALPTASPRLGLRAALEPFLNPA